MLRAMQYDITIYITSLNIDIGQQTDQERIFHIFKAMGLKHKVCDLYLNVAEKQKYQKEIADLGCSLDMIPIIVINGIYVGGVDEL